MLKSLVCFSVLKSLRRPKFSLQVSNSLQVLIFKFIKVTPPLVGRYLQLLLSTDCRLIVHLSDPLLDTEALVFPFLGCSSFGSIKDTARLIVVFDSVFIARILSGI